MVTWCFATGDRCCFYFHCMTMLRNLTCLFMFYFAIFSMFLFANCQFTFFQLLFVHVLFSFLFRNFITLNSMFVCQFSSPATFLDLSFSQQKLVLRCESSILKAHSFAPGNNIRISKFYYIFEANIMKFKLWLII